MPDEICAWRSRSRAFLSATWYQTRPPTTRPMSAITPPTAPITLRPRLPPSSSSSPSAGLTASAPGDASLPFAAASSPAPEAAAGFESAPPFLSVAMRRAFTVILRVAPVAGFFAARSSGRFILRVVSRPVVITFLNSSISASKLGKRSSFLKASIFVTRASIWGESSGLSELGFGGGFEKRALTTAVTSSPSNGGLPVSAWKSVPPRLYMSAR